MRNKSLKADNPELRALYDHIRQVVNLILPEDVNLVTLSVDQGKDASHIVVTLHRVEGNINLNAAEFHMSKYKEVLIGAIHSKVHHKAMPHIDFQLSPIVLFSK